MLTASRRPRAPGWGPFSAPHVPLGRLGSLRCLTEAESGQSRLHVESQFNFSAQSIQGAAQLRSASAVSGPGHRSLSSTTAHLTSEAKDTDCACLPQESLPGSSPDPPFPRCLRFHPRSPALFPGSQRPRAQAALGVGPSLPPAAGRPRGSLRRDRGPNNVRLHPLQRADPRETHRPPARPGGRRAGRSRSTSTCTTPKRFCAR